jgi:flagellar protein FliL
MGTALVDKQTQPASGSDRANARSWVGAIAGLIAITMIAAGTGIAAAWLLKSGKISGVEVTATEPVRSNKAVALSASIPNGHVVKPVPTIITNLAGDRRVWVRAEFSVLMPPNAAASDALAAQIGQDTIMYLRGITPAQIEGPHGLALLREEIEERVRVRTEGRSKGILFKSFVLE